MLTSIDGAHAHDPAARRDRGRRALRGRHRRAGRQRQDRAGRRAVPRAARRAVAGVVTNDIYTTEDADFLRRHGVLPDERIVAVRDRLLPAHRDPRRHHRQPRRHRGPRGARTARSTSCSSRAAATTSPPRSARASSTCRSSCVDVAGGDKVPRKGGPGVTRSDLLVINKTDLAPLVGADLEVMAPDAERLRGDLPTVFVSLREQPDAAPIAEWVTALVRARGVTARRTEGRDPGDDAADRRARCRPAVAPVDARLAGGPAPDRRRRAGAPGPRRGRSARRRRPRTVRRRRSGGTARRAQRGRDARAAGCGDRRARAVDGRAAGRGGRPGALGAGADGGERRGGLESTVRVALATGAVATVREIVVLGRHGQRGRPLRRDHARRRRRRAAARAHHTARRGRPEPLRAGGYRRGACGRDARARRGGRRRDPLRRAAVEPPMSAGRGRRSTGPGRCCWRSERPPRWRPCSTPRAAVRPTTGRCPGTVAAEPGSLVPAPGGP